MTNNIPFARSQNIVVQDLGNEILVCDLQSNKVFCLNSTAGDVWKLCDGKTNVKEISRRLSRKMKVNVSEELVLFSLGELQSHNLLTKKIAANDLFEGSSRREILKRIGTGAMIALPIISSVLMPRAVQAQSGCVVGNPQPNGCACTDAFDCDSLCCATNTGVCATLDTSSTCGGGVDCPEPFICCVHPITGPAGSNCSCDGFC